jgi:hypothetical protein
MILRTAAAIGRMFFPDIEFPLLPFTSGQVGAVDPVRDVGEVGHGT